MSTSPCPTIISALAHLFPVQVSIRRASDDLFRHQCLIGNKLFTGEPKVGLATYALAFADKSVCEMAALVRSARESGAQEIINRADVIGFLERIREAAAVIEAELTLVDEARMDAHDARIAVPA